MSCGKAAIASASSSARASGSGDDLVDEADRERLGGVDLAAGEDQVERAAEPDDARQPLRAAVDQRHAPAALQAPEARVLARDPQVAPERQLEPAGHAPAADRRDRRLDRA